MTGSPIKKSVAALIALGAVLGSGAAHAQDKAGPVMLNLKLGPSIPVAIKDQPSGSSATDVLPVSFSLTLEGGIALDQARQAYLVLPFQILVGTKSASAFGFSYSLTSTRVVVPIGFQYDIPIRAVPGLFLYPRASLGYQAYIVSASGQRDTTHGLQVAPEFGVKYVLRRRWNFALEPFSLPVSVLFPRDNSGSVQSGWIIDYRINFSAGVNL